MRWPFRKAPFGRGFVLLAVFLATSAVALERGSRLGSWLLPNAGERSWIWIPDDPRDARPVSVYFVRDFELGSVPEDLTVEVLGDPEYVLWLNAHRISSNRFRLPGSVERYRVAPWLLQGSNRWVAEVRSPTAAGAFSLALRDGSGRILVQTDDTWKLARSYTRGIEYPEMPFRAEGVRVLASGPMGRWARARLGPFGKTFEEGLEIEEVRTAQSYRVSTDRAGWRPLPQVPHGTVDLGIAVEFDFGKIETGFLQLSISGHPLAGLAFFGEEPFWQVPEEAGTLVLPVPERGLWQDAEPRRFRYVLVLGLDGVRSAAVLPMQPEVLERWKGSQEDRGLWGLRPPPSRSPVEHVLRRELQHLPGWS